MQKIISIFANQSLGWKLIRDGVNGRMADGGGCAADGSSPLFSVDAGKGFVQSAKSRIALIRRGRDWTVQHQPKPCS